MIGTTFAAIYIFSLGKYDSTELGSTDDDIYVKFDVLLLGDSLGSLYGLEIVCNEGNELWIYDDRVLGTPLGTYDGTYVGLS